MIKLDRLKYGKKNALTLSYDDGRNSDRRLVEIMNKYGIRGTFHLNSGRLGETNRISGDEISMLYKGHEVACHGAMHRTLSVLPQQNIIQEVLEDRRVLEKISDSIVRGMSYANGAYSDESIKALEACGIVYSRTTQNTGCFVLPDDFMKWNPTCHHRDCIIQGKRFIETIESKYFSRPRLFYVWGHSYEFDNDNNWEMIEEFCQMMSGHNEIWYATNIEIYEYINAQRKIVVSADNSMVHNPTAIQIWFTSNGELKTIMPGEILKLN